MVPQPGVRGDMQDRGLASPHWKTVVWKFGERHMQKVSMPASVQTASRGSSGRLGGSILLCLSVKSVAVVEKGLQSGSGGAGVDGEHC